MVANESIVLNVIAGSSPQPSRVLTAGAPVSPFSVGSCGDWQITAPDVDGAHFYLAFDGQRLHIAAVSPGSDLFVLGTRMGTSFVPLTVPCNLFFGGACIAVTASAASVRTVPLSVRQKSRHLPDLSRSAQVQTQLFEASQAMHMRTQRMEIPASVLAALREAPNSSQAALEHPEKHEVLPARVATLSGNVDLGCTLYDGGALREQAMQLASGSLAPTAQPPNAVAAVEPGAERPSLFREPLLALRRASRVRQLALLLAPLAVVVGAGGLRGIGSSAPASAASARSAAAHSAAADPMSTAAPTALAVVSKVPSAPPQSAAPAPSNGLERAALAAAFNGNKWEAAQLYERLAEGHNARVFALAAQLVRADHVRKP